MHSNHSKFIAYILAHFHHMIENVRIGVPLKRAIIQSSKKSYSLKYLQDIFVIFLQPSNFPTLQYLESILHIYFIGQVLLKIELSILRDFTIDILLSGHFLSPFLAHAFCNHMGFPDFPALMAYEKPLRNKIIVTTIIGFIIWVILLVPLTSPNIYKNELSWSE